MPANDNCKKPEPSAQEASGARFVDDDSYGGIIFFLDKAPKVTQAYEPPAAKPRKHLPEPFDYYPH